MVRKLNISRARTSPGFTPREIQAAAHEVDQALFLRLLRRMPPRDRRVVTALLKRLIDLQAAGRADEAVDLIDDIEIIVTTALD